jgi:azurin
MKTQIKSSIFAVICMIALSACGGNTKTEETTTTDATTQTAVASGDGVTLEIEANDQMQFNVTELKAVAGQEITLVLKNVGKMGKTVMGHNVIILKTGTDVAEYAKKAMLARETDYLPASESESVIAATKLTGGGETDTITFTITEKGTYDFICSFPGHYALMKGKLIVE